ncbi:MAG TPA: SRPBCC family protein [Candidatus Acidoferrum sp.]|nr:SRPBCC family protein [Candidatus Acidoferrum sp.]
METRHEQMVTDRAGLGVRGQGYGQERGSLFRRSDSFDRGRQEPWLAISGNAEQDARGLGWLSIGFGLAEVMAPHSLARFLGIRNHGILFRLMGLREIATGIGILTQRRPAGWLWARVGGDIMDLIALRKAFNSERAKPVNIAIATIVVGGITALDACCAQELSESNGAETDGTVKVMKTILINRPPEELYRYWRDLQNLPRFMKNLESVDVTALKISRWTAKGPAEASVKWDAEITEDQSNEYIAWRSLEGADVENSGWVRFEAAPGGRGTIVSVEMQYSPPAGALGATVAKILGRAPEQEVEEDLRRFKQVMETGEIITTEGQPAGRSSSTSWKYDQTIRRAIASS